MLRYADIKRAETAAYGTLIRYGDGYLPIDVRTVVSACRCACVMTYAEAVEALHMDEGEFSRLAASDEVFVIRRDAETGAKFLLLTSAKRENGRERFSMAHELGHMLLGHISGESVSETEANAFAAAFLCPRPVLRKAGLTRARDVAAAFGISLEAAKIALERAGMPDRADGEVCAALLRRFNAHDRNCIEDYIRISDLADFFTARMGKRKSPCIPSALRDNGIASALDEMERLIEIRMDACIC